MKTRRELLTILDAREKSKSQRFVTGEESWFTLEFHYSTKWNAFRDDSPSKVT
jgi:hypothetical protein